MDGQLLVYNKQMTSSIVPGGGDGSRRGHGGGANSAESHGLSGQSDSCGGGSCHSLRPHSCNCCCCWLGAGASDGCGHARGPGGSHPQYLILA